jgi:hypothetical protein
MTQQTIRQVTNLNDVSVKHSKFCKCKKCNTRRLIIKRTLAKRAKQKEIREHYEYLKQIRLGDAK